MDAPYMDVLSIETSQIKYCVISCTDKNSADELHSHDYPELFVNVSGNVSFVVNDTVYKLKGGEFIFIRPYDIHSFAFDPEDKHDSHFLWFECNIPQIDKFVNAENFKHDYYINEYDMNNMDSNFRCFVEDVKIDNEIAKISCFFNILNIVLAQKKGSDCYKSAKKEKLPAEMHRVMEYINLNFARIEFVRQIADDNYVSSATLNRWFKKYFRTTPCEYLQSKKLAYARKLLDEGMSVLDACMASGFSDCSYFISMFKKKNGITPAKYAKNVNSKTIQ